MHWVVTGPTASGKSEIGLRLAEQKKLEAFNCDSFQLYREVPIISNQTAKTLRFTAIRSLKDKPWSVREFSEEIYSSIDQPSLLIGSGLFLGGVLYGFDEQKGTPFQGKPRLPYRMLVLDPPRDWLYEKINERVDEMIQKGAFEEAQAVWKSLQQKEVSAGHPALKAIGLKELLSYFEGQMEREEAVYKWKQSTRRLAKRQWTWLRKFCPPSENCDWVSTLEAKKLDLGTL